MKKNRFHFLILLLNILVINLPALSQKIHLLDSREGVSLRGLSAVNDSVFWVSGSKGTVAKSADGGKSMVWMQVKNYEERDFRDIEAFDSKTAIIMAVDAPAVILKTYDGGMNWKKVFEDSTKGMFLDAMDFTGKNGIVIGDPVKGSFFMAATNDSGDNWHKINLKDSFGFPFKGEAFFAASGSNIVFKNQQDKLNFLYVSGGEVSRIFWQDHLIKKLPMLQGKNSTGANAIAINKNKGIVVGGDFSADTIDQGNCVLLDFTLQDIQFSKPEIPPQGYRSSVCYITGEKLITCGTSGIDISLDGGKIWKKISNQSFHVCQIAKNGTKVFLAGSKGKIAFME